jgi:hypothetical protein
MTGIGMARKRRKKDAQNATAQVAPRWASWPDERLLKLRLKDLKLPLRGTWLAACLRELNAEMAEKGLKRVRAHGWISSEWFSPGNTAGHRVSVLPGASAPDAARTQDDHRRRGRHPRRMHAHPPSRAGHVLQHSYALHKQPRWRRLFGRSSIRYPKYYRADPTSRNFVQHLRLWYAQSHPDEDFAETFAVWLTPRSNWRKRYEGWPALKKLQYVDELMAELANRKPVLSRRTEVEPLRSLRTTLGEHYQKKLEHYSVDAPRAYDRDLLRIFSNNPRHRHSPPAAPSSAITAATSGGWFPNGPASTSSRSTRCLTR